MRIAKVTVGLSVIIGQRVGLDPVDVFQIGKLAERGCVGDADAVFGREVVQKVLRELAV